MLKNKNLKKFKDKKSITAKIKYVYSCISTFILLNFAFVAPAYADNNTLQSVINLLKGGVCCLGGVLVIWGLIQLGLGWKDGSGGGGQINGALGFIIGGAAVFGAGMLMGMIDTSWVTG